MKRYYERHPFGGRQEERPAKTEKFIREELNRIKALDDKTRQKILEQISEQGIKELAQTDPKRAHQEILRIIAENKPMEIDELRAPVSQKPEAAKEEKPAIESSPQYSAKKPKREKSERSNWDDDGGGSHGKHGRKPKYKDPLTHRPSQEMSEGV